MKSTADRLAIADEIVRRVDTVTLLKCEEVTDIRRRALAGEFDDIFGKENDHVPMDSGPVRVPALR